MGVTARFAPQLASHHSSLRTTARFASSHHSSLCITARFAPQPATHHSQLRTIAHFASPHSSLRTTARTRARFAPQLELRTTARFAPQLASHHSSLSLVHGWFSFAGSKFAGPLVRCSLDRCSFGPLRARAHITSSHACARTCKSRPSRPPKKSSTAMVTEALITV